MTISIIKAVTSLLQKKSQHSGNSGGAWTRSKIRELDELAQRLGLEAIREACIVPLFKAIDRPAEYFAAKAKVSERLRSLIEQLS